jgi:hypothetical protein
MQILFYSMYVVFFFLSFCLSNYIELEDGVHIHNHTRGGGGWSWSSIQEEEEATEWHFPLARGKACDEMTGSLNFGVRVKSFGKLCLAPLPVTVIPFFKLLLQKTQQR